MENLKNEVFNVKKIETCLKSRNLSKTKFCKKFNFSLSSLNSILNQKLGVKLNVVFLLAKKIRHTN